MPTVRLCSGDGAKPAMMSREVVGRDDDVAVVDEDVGMARVRQHLDEVRDLAVGAEDSRAFDDADGVVGKLLLKLADGGDGGIVRAS